MRKRDELVLSAVAGRRATSTGWVRGNCCWCEIKTGKADRKQCLGLHLATGKWHCFRCGAAGLLQEVPDDFAHLHPSPPLAAEEAKQAMEPPEGYCALFEGTDDWLAQIAGGPMREYLTGKGRTPAGERKRELSEDVCREARIGGVLEGCGGGCEPRCTRCKLRGRVIVPILSAEGEWLGWSARATFKSTRKYLYPTGMRRADILFNHAALHVETDRPAFVVEGVFDALWLWPDAVAVLGKPSGPQKEAFIVARRPVVVVLDGDAWREADALTRTLRFNAQRAGYIRLPPEVDPDEVDRRELDTRAMQSLEAANGA